MKKLKIFLFFLSIFLLFFCSFFIFWQIYLKKEAKIKEIQKEIEKISQIISEKGLPSEVFNFGSFPLLVKDDFFEKTKKELIEKELDFLLIDLSEKRIDFFEKGKYNKSYSVLAFGKEGSFWETPVGFYQVEAKIKKAFSSLGQVYMPYSLQFQGNFFIHGWPYFPNGQPVSSSFSGGCIRLSNEDAREIFEKVKIGTPVLITESSFLNDRFSYYLKEPQLSATSYLVADLKNNFLFLEKNSNNVLAIYSITKLMTALVAIEYINLWKEIEIQKSDLIFTSKKRLKEGQLWSGFDLLFPLLTESSNEAAKTISRFLGEKKFVELMNKKVKSLGMEETQFEDPFGGERNFSSAKNLFSFAKYLYNNRRFILDITRGKSYPHLTLKSFQDLENFNCFSRKENFVGGKTGKSFTKGETFLGIFEIEFRGEKRPIVIVLLGSSDSCAEAEKILNWLKEKFQ